MAKAGNTGFKRILRAVGFSAAGIRSAWRHEAAFRQEILLVIVLTPIAFWLGDTPLVRVALIASLLLILVAELLNSAIEATVDRIGDAPHELAGRAKDMGSAAVFVAFVLAALVWGAVLWQRVYD